MPPAGATKPPPPKPNARAAHSAPMGPGAGRDEQIGQMAAAFGVEVPHGTWQQMFEGIANELPHACALVDMKVPGLPLCFVNPAFMHMTQYDKESALGKNCRFLQGAATEAAAVRVMVNAIREAKPCTLRLTNYRKDQSQFTNVLTFQPVHDTTNEYRYSIAIMGDLAHHDQEHESLEKLRHVLPKKFDVILQPRKYEVSLTNVDTTAQRKQWKSSLAKFTPSMVDGLGDVAPHDDRQSELASDARQMGGERAARRRAQARAPRPCRRADEGVTRAAGHRADSAL